MISGAKWRLIGYWQGCSAMELRLRVSRSTVDIDLTLQRVPTGATPSSSFGDWFEYTIGLPIMDLTTAPYGGPLSHRGSNGCTERLNRDPSIQLREDLRQRQCNVAVLRRQRGPAELMRAQFVEGPCDSLRRVDHPDVFHAGLHVVVQFVVEA